MHDIEQFIRGFAQFQQRLMDEPIARATQRPPAPPRNRPVPPPAKPAGSRS
ncbi:hypothetical protein ACFQ1A_17090 [Massilia pinisoli]|uniref:hypothetical protein n=1 Tax=Massilia pinisoli TaxID=1772194 RepID=UPI0036440895